MPAAGLRQVRLLALPLVLHELAEAHTDGLLREFRLLLEQSQARGGDVPERLLTLVHDLQRQYSGVSEEQEVVVEEALARGDRVLPELLFAVPPDVGPACTALLALLDEADVYCTAGRHLLMLATPLELVAYRSWYLGEFVSQLAGARPLPWPDSAGARRG